MSAADTDDHFFRTLCESCGVGFWHIDSAGHTIYLNQTMCTMLELDSAADIGTTTFHRFFTPQSIERMRLEHGKRVQGLSSTYEVELIGVRGGRRNAVISGAPVSDRDGRLAGMIGTFTDITDQRRAELALRESESQLRSLFAASIDALGVSHAGRHMIVNPAYLRMFGYSDMSQLRDKPIFELIAPSERAKVRAFVRERSAGESVPPHYVTRGLRSNGEEFPLEVRVSGYEESGDFYTVVILRDITERLQLEDQLRQSQKMDALGRLAGGVAHDFNNLLMVMMGCTELIAADPQAGDAAKANAQLIHTTGERAVALTRQLLALSRRQVIDPKVMDLNQVVGEMTAMLRRLIGPRVALHVASQAELGRIRADPGQIQQVLMNLCVNARDAMPHGGQIVIRTQNVQLDAQQVRPLLDVAPGPFVLLSVADTGLGIDAATQQRMFEPFFTTKALGEGTGLGLATVYGIVKQSGGHVTVTSAPGAGSTFSVYLPIVDAPLAPPRSETALLPVGNVGTILLVEDELEVRQLVQQFLQTAGYRVLSASDGREALELFRAEGQRIDAVVTDLLMPGLSGIELAGALDKLASALPILFISGYAHDGGSTVAERPGSAFLAKPFSAAQLTKQLRALLAPPLAPGE